jgi:hypothetical protein
VIIFVKKERVTGYSARMKISAPGADIIPYSGAKWHSVLL